MENEYLKTHEDVEVVSDAKLYGQKLDKLQQEFDEIKPKFQKAMHDLTERLNIVLWHSPDHETYHWEDKGRNSIQYPSRESALRALLDENIEWVKE